MKRLTRRLGAFCLCLSLLSVQPVNGRAGSAFAQSSATYDLTWHVIAVGGATFSASARDSLGGTLGQPSAGRLGEGVYTLTGGFWAAIASSAGSVYLPLVVR